jgi:hypothetical protein
MRFNSSFEFLAFAAVVSAAPAPRPAPTPTAAAPGAILTAVVNINGVSPLLNRE